MGNRELDRKGFESIDWRQLFESERIMVLLRRWDLTKRIASRIAIASPVKTDEEGGHLKHKDILEEGIHTAAPTGLFSDNFEASV